MVKSLQEICLGKIALWSDALDTKTFSKGLTRHARETLLNHMCCHQQIEPASLPFVKAVILKHPLRRIELHYSSYVNDHILECIAKSSQALEHVSILSCKNVTDTGLKQMLNRQSKLRFLRLQSLPLVTGACLSYLQSNNLRTLILRNMFQLKDMFVVEAVANCPQIGVLDLQYCPEISNACVMGVSAVLKEKLAVLRISGISGITDRSLEGLSLNCRKLKELKLYGCNKLSTEGINKMLKSLEIVDVDLSYTCAYHGGTDVAHFQAVDFVPTLQRFVSCGVQIPAYVLVDLVSQCKMLSTLVLCGIRSVDDGLIKEIANVSRGQLKELDLSYCDKVSDIGLGIVVKKCTSLQSLTFQHFQGTGVHIKKYMEEDRRTQAGNLKNLHLPACRHFDGRIIDLIVPYFNALEQLDLSGMKHITDDVLSKVSIYCKRLKLLSIKGCKEISDEGAGLVLSSGSPLEKLVFSGVPKLTDKTIFTMVGCISNTLKLLYISGCTRISSPVIQYLKDECVNGLFVQHRIPNAPEDRLMGKNLDTGEFLALDGRNEDPYYWTPTV